MAIARNTLKQVLLDNQKFIMEELHKLIPDLDIVWVKDPKYEYELPA